MRKIFRNRDAGDSRSREDGERREAESTQARPRPAYVRSRDTASQVPDSQRSIQENPTVIARSAPPEQRATSDLVTGGANLRRAQQALPGDEIGGSQLIVGRGIQLKGEIASCDTLVVEGHVEASMDSRLIRITESGVFIGEASIDYADIVGRFEGELTARRRLVIHPSGRVLGRIRFSAIQIEEGGQIVGDVQVIDGSEQPASTRRRRKKGGSRSK